MLAQYGRNTHIMLRYVQCRYAETMKIWAEVTLFCCDVTMRGEVRVQWNANPKSVTAHFRQITTHR